MARLIDADAIKYRTLSYGGWGGPPEEIADKYLIDKMPTVDAVPVVRCKDCKHYVWDEFDGCYVCLSISRFVKPDFWCAHGERRSNEAD